MELPKELCEVVSDIEYLIGSECYNPNSYDGWEDIEGCDFRYPITVLLQSDEYYKLKGWSRIYNFFLEGTTPRMLTYMKYKFGSNELFIGRGILKTLDYLEERYGLNFLELEKERARKTAKD